MVLIVAVVTPSSSACSGAKTCSSAAIDVVAGASGGSPTARSALDLVLQHPPARLSKAGWAVAKQDRSMVTFTAGSDRVEVTRVADGTWMETGYTAC